MDLGALLSVVPQQDVVYVMAACGLGAALDAWLPVTPKDSRWFWCRRLLSLLGQNYRNAVNSKPLG